MSSATPNSLPTEPSICPKCEKPCNPQAESDTVTPDSVHQLRRLVAQLVGSAKALEREVIQIEAKLKT